MVNLKLEVGKSYINGYDQVLLITDRVDGKFITTTPFTFFENGKMSLVHSHRLDFVREYTGGQVIFSDVVLIPGKFYYTRGGETVSVDLAPFEPDTEFHFIGDNGMYYTPDGRIYNDREILSPLDITGNGPSTMINENCIAPYGKPMNMVKTRLRVDIVIEPGDREMSRVRKIMQDIAEHPNVRRVVVQYK